MVVRGQLLGIGSPSSMWVLRTELRLLSLVASISTHGTIFPVAALTIYPPKGHTNALVCMVSRKPPKETYINCEIIMQVM